MNDVAARGKSEFTIAKILHTDQDSVFAITAESTGRVRLVKVSKNIVGSRSHIIGSLYECVFQTVFSIENYYLQAEPAAGDLAAKNNLCLTAIAGLNRIRIV